MDSARNLVEEIRRFVAESPLNRHQDGLGPYFESPLVGFASADDPLFDRYKTIIGDFHLTPREFFEDSFGAGAYAGGTVVCWILPVSQGTRLTNRIQDRMPSRRWAHTRHFGEQFNAELRRHVVGFLAASGHRAVAPLLSPRWKMVEGTPAGIASTWSERHAAFAAGLGTFSLNDGLITARGIAHRVGSVVTDLVLPPTERPYREHREYCLHFRGEACGACAERCPVGAVSDTGHDKGRCYEHVYGTVRGEVGDLFGVREAGCGLCQTGVPCESRIPRSRGDGRARQAD